jgi:hypothetical protein
MTHEMVHYAFTSMSEEHHWIEEGIGTYVEPIALLEAGQIRAARVWDDLVRGLPFGLPQPGDEGLDHTHTWGRTYWGGAMFCLLADVRIRQENERSLWPARCASRNRSCWWEYAGHVGAYACARRWRQGRGVPVLMQLYNEMKTTPIRPAAAETHEINSAIGRSRVPGATSTSTVLSSILIGSG